jgi:hypothetical protein
LVRVPDIVSFNTKEMKREVLFAAGQLWESQFNHLSHLQSTGEGQRKFQWKVQRKFLCQTPESKLTHELSLRAESWQDLQFQID